MGNYRIGGLGSTTLQPPTIIEMVKLYNQSHLTLTFGSAKPTVVEEF